MNNLKIKGTIVTCRCIIPVFFILALLCLPVHSQGGTNILNVPIILQDGTYKGREVTELCGVTCAEMVLKYYGIKNISNVDIAERFCSDMYPKYNRRMNYSASQKKIYSTDCENSLAQGGVFTGTNTHVLQLFFDDLGFQTDRKRSLYDKKSGAVPGSRFVEIMTHVRKKRPVIIHTENHYMLVIGYDDSRKILNIIDPSDKILLNVSYMKFLNRNSRWRRTRPKRKGWDGRFLAVWK